MREAGLTAPGGQVVDSRTERRTLTFDPNKLNNKKTNNGRERGKYLCAHTRIYVKIQAVVDAALFRLQREALK